MFYLCGRTVQSRRLDCSVFAVRLFNSKRSGCSTWAEYSARSVNSMIASLNSLFSFLGWTDCRVKSIKLQRQIYCPEEKELTKAEYMRLVNTAKQKGNERLNLILQTICGTGIL